MKKFVITYAGKLFEFSLQANYEIIMCSDISQVMEHLNNKYIKDKGYWELDSDNFTAHYNSIGKRLSSMINDYAVTQREKSIEIYDGENTSKIEIFEIIDLYKSFAIVQEVDVPQAYIVSKKTYHKIINQIDNLRILYNQAEGDNIDYSNQFEWLDNYESVFFSNELLDYNEFDYKTGEIKEVNLIGGNSNTESSLEITLIDHFIINKI